MIRTQAAWTRIFWPNYWSVQTSMGKLWIVVHIGLELIYPVVKLVSNKSVIMCIALIKFYGVEW